MAPHSLRSQSGHSSGERKSLAGAITRRRDRERVACRLDVHADPARDAPHAGRGSPRGGAARQASASFATSSSVREHYRITVQDNGEPNQGLDTFAIDTESYDAAGPVQHGNVQLHKQQ
jgi:hypothetical protein